MKTQITQILTSSTRPPRWLQAGLAVALVLLGASRLPVDAATRTWDGSYSGYWSAPLNWTGGVAPSSGDDLVFPAGAANLANTNNSQVSRVRSITISGSGYVLRGSGTTTAITLTNGLSATYAAGSSTVELDVALGATQEFQCTTAGATLSVSGDINLGSFTLTADGAGTARLGGAISGGGRLTKNGTGSLRLYGSTANTYSGLTRVNVGTLELYKSSSVNALAGDLIVGNNIGTDTVRWLQGAQLPSTTDVTVNQGAVLDLNNFGEALGALTLNGGTAQTGSGVLTLGANVLIQSNANTAVISGNLSLGGVTRTFTVSAAASGVELEMLANIRSGSAGIHWVGLPFEDPITHGYHVPQVHLHGSNSYGGITLITNMHLFAHHPLAFGETNQGTSLAGSSLILVDVAVANETLFTLPGSFSCGLYADGISEWAGPVVLGVETYLEGWNDAVGLLDLSGPMSGTGDVLVYATQFGGSVTVRFSGAQANTYDGTTYVQSGMLQLAKTVSNAAIPGGLVIGGALVATNQHLLHNQIPSSSSITVNAGSVLDLNNRSDLIGALTLNGGAVRTGTGLLSLGGNVTALASASDCASIEGNIALPSTRTFNIANSSCSPDLNLFAAISGTGGLVKTGAGALGLYASNVFSGGVTVNEGLVYLHHDVALGTTAGGTVVNDGGVLVLANGRQVGAEPLTLNGNGDGIAGALASIGGSNSWAGTVTLATDSVITVQTNRVLNLAGAVTGPGGFIKAQPGTLILSGSAANAFAGNALVNAGTLLLDKTGVDRALPGPGDLIIGDGLGGADADIVRLLRWYQIASSVAILVNDSGLLDLNGNSDAVGGLKLAGGHVDSGAGLLTLGGNVSARSTTNRWCAIDGRLALGSGTRSFDVASVAHAPQPALRVSAQVSGSGGLRKTGTGRMDLSSSNDYSGVTTVAEGTLDVRHDFALGSTAAGTVVQDQGKLRLVYVHVGDETLTLYGLGYYGSGTLADASVDYTNSWAGIVILASDTRIDVGGGSDDAIDLRGPISGPGGFEKTGAGTLILSDTNANTYAGTTYVNEGTLSLAKTGGDDRAIPGNLVIGDGTGGANADVLQREDTGWAQINDLATVTVNSSGLFEFPGTSGENIGALAGAGSVHLGNSTLRVGYNNTSTTFAGVISGAGGNLEKWGTGTFTLGGNNTYSGATYVAKGTLLVNGSQPASPVEVANGDTLGGTGIVGLITSTGGTVSPGVSPGTLTSSNVVLDGASDFIVELTGTGHDQLNARGSVTLGSAALALSATGLLPVEGEAFVILNNDAAEAVAGTFAGLAEGALVSAGPRQFQLTYTGGSGNDVVLIATNTAALRPGLSIWHTTTNTVVVSWPQSDLAWLLHVATNLSPPPISWTEIPPPYQTNGANLQFTEPAPTGNKFYRLQKP